jgi:hypothetical protein
MNLEKNELLLIRALLQKKLNQIPPHTSKFINIKTTLNKVQAELKNIAVLDGVVERSCVDEKISELKNYAQAHGLDPTKL